MTKHVHWVWKYTRDAFHKEYTNQQELDEFLEWADKENGITQIYIYDTPPVYVKP
jgi:hypothetical protein